MHVCKEDLLGTGNLVMSLTCSSKMSDQSATGVQLISGRYLVVDPTEVVLRLKAVGFVLVANHL